jgi:hypothetical protein
MDAFPNDPLIKGDINNDGGVDLTDAMLAMQIIMGIQPSLPVHAEADVNGGQKIGPQEAEFILQKESGVRLRP